MKRRVKVLRPLDEYETLDAQMLDPRWPQFCAKVNEDGRSQWMASTQPTQRQEGIISPGSLERNKPTLQGQQIASRFASLPEYVTRDTSWDSPIANQKPAETSRLNLFSSNKPTIAMATIGEKMQGEDSSAKSGCSTASIVDVDHDMADFPQAASQRRLKDSQAEGQGLNDVHVAARRSLEMSRQQGSRPSTAPMAIPSKKHPRKGFFRL